MEKPKWDQVGEAFVEQYYKLFDSNQKQVLINMYHANALLTYEDSKVMGQSAIRDILLNKVTFQIIRRTVTECDCQPTPDDGVVIMITGKLTKSDGDQAHPYTEVFVLKPDAGTYVIFHHIHP